MRLIKLHNKLLNIDTEKIFKQKHFYVKNDETLKIDAYNDDSSEKEDNKIDKTKNLNILLSS